MDKLLENLDKINELHAARLKRIDADVKRYEKSLRDQVKERRKLENDHKAKSEEYSRFAAEYMGIEAKIEAEIAEAIEKERQFKENFRTGKERLSMEEFSAKSQSDDQIRARIRGKHLERLKEATAAVRDIHRQIITFEMLMAKADEAIERTRLTLFDVWQKCAEVTLSDYERYRPGNMRIHFLADQARQKDAEWHIATKGGYPFHIQLTVETKEALMRMPLDSRFLEKHLPEVYEIVNTHRNLDFKRKFLMISYMSSPGFHPEGINVTVKNKPGVPDEDGIIEI